MRVLQRRSQADSLTVLLNLLKITALCARHTARRAVSLPGCSLRVWSFAFPVPPPVLFPMHNNMHCIATEHERGFHAFSEREFMRDIVSDPNCCLCSFFQRCAGWIDMFVLFRICIHPVNTATRNSSMFMKCHLFSLFQLQRESQLRFRDSQARQYRRDHDRAMRRESYDA